MNSIVAAGNPNTLNFIHKPTAKLRATYRLRIANAANQTTHNRLMTCQVRGARSTGSLKAASNMRRTSGCLPNNALPRKTRAVSANRMVSFH